MQPLARSLAVLVVVIGAVIASQPRAAAPSPAALLTPAGRSAGLSFAPDVAPADRRVVLDSIAGARPEARRLIEAVDGLVTVEVGQTGENGAVGLTRSAGNRFEVTLDLGRVWHEWGQRGASRLVLHELGHVVDFVLVPAALEQKLDAEIPAGYACDPGVPTGACAARQERFAETFAKWATGDIGVDIQLGYKVLPPASLEEWGRPLSGLGDG